MIRTLACEHLGIGRGGGLSTCSLRGIWKIDQKSKINKWLSVLLWARSCLIVALFSINKTAPKCHRTMSSTKSSKFANIYNHKRKCSKTSQKVAQQQSAVAQQLSAPSLPSMIETRERAQIIKLWWHARVQRCRRNFHNNSNVVESCTATVSTSSNVAESSQQQSAQSLP